MLPYVDRWYFSEVLAGVESTLIGAGFDLTLYNLNGGPDQRAQIFNDFLLRRRGRCDADDRAKAHGR